MHIPIEVSIQLISLASRDFSQYGAQRFFDIVSIQLISLASRDLSRCQSNLAEVEKGFHSINFSSE